MLQKKQEQQLVVQSNPLIEAQYKLPFFSQILIRMAISKILPSDYKFEKNYYGITAQEISELTRRKINSVYYDMEKHTKLLLRSVIIIPKRISENNQTLATTWLASVEYYHGEGRVELEFSSKLEPELLRLKKEFTQYYLENIANLDSQYSIRNYELLKQYQSIGERIYEINAYRLAIGIEENKYKRYNDFKRNVLIKSEEINTKTDLIYKWAPIKTGRRISHIRFYDIQPNPNFSIHPKIIYTPPQNKKKTDRSKLAKNQIPSEKEIPVEIFSLIPKSQRSTCKIISKKIFREKGLECLNWYIEYATKKAKDNLAGYIQTIYKLNLWEQEQEQARLINEEVEKVKKKQKELNNLKTAKKIQFINQGKPLSKIYPLEHDGNTMFVNTNTGLIMHGDLIRLFEIGKLIIVK